MKIKTISIIALALSALALTGCGGGEAKASAPDPDIVALQQQVAALTTRLAKAEAAAEADQLTTDQPVPAAVGTVIAYNGAAHAASAAFITSRRGYLAQLPTDGASIAADQFFPIWYTTADCSGTGYLRDGFGALGAKQGFVFRTNADPLNAGAYYMVASGTAQDPSLFFNSKLTSSGVCAVQAFGPTFGWPITPNAEALSGVPSGPYPAGLTLGPRP